MFCSVMKVRRSELKLRYMPSDSEKISFFEIEKEGDSEITGSYLFCKYKDTDEDWEPAVYPGGEYRAIYKKVDAEKLRRWKIQGRGENVLYESVYFKPEGESVPEDKIKKPTLERSTVRSYEGKRLSGAEAEGGRGYVNTEGQYVVPYANEYDYWFMNSFENGVWKKKALPMNPESGKAHHFFTEKGEFLWYNNDILLQVNDGEAKKLASMDLKKWKRKHGLEKDNTIEYSYLESPNILISTE